MCRQDSKESTEEKKENTREMYFHLEMTDYIEEMMENTEDKRGDE